MESNTPMLAARRGNLRLMREINTKIVLDAIRQADSISQVELIKRTHLSAGTIVNVVRDLKRRDLVKEIGPGESEIGRKPIQLRFHAEAKHVVIATLFPDEISVALLDLGGRILGRVSFATQADKGPERVFENIFKQTDHLMQSYKVPPSNLMGFGVCSMGIVDDSEQVLRYSANLNWRDVPILGMVRERYQVPATLEVSAPAMALGESRFGSARGVKDLVLVEVDAGIGCAILLDGKLVRGHHHIAGEIGHTLAVYGGATCRCGKRGCLETVASGDAVVAAARREAAGSRATLLSEDKHVDAPELRVAIRAVVAAAQRRDEVASRLIEVAGRQLGIAVANVINLVDPEIVVLTGAFVEESRGVLTQVIRRVADEHIVDAQRRSISFIEGTLGPDATILGTASSIYNKLFGIAL